MKSIPTCIRPSGKTPLNSSLMLLAYRYIDKSYLAPPSMIALSMARGAERRTTDSRAMRPKTSSSCSCESRCVARPVPHEGPCDIVPWQTEHPDVQGVSVGAILSNYQRVRVEHVCVLRLRESPCSDRELAQMPPIRIDSSVLSLAKGPTGTTVRNDRCWARRCRHQGGRDWTHH